MGFSKKSTSSNHPMDGNIVESETKKGWIIAGIKLRSPLKPILTSKNWNKHVDEEQEQEEYFATTPTYEESRLSRKCLTCPPAPKKRKTSSRCHNSNNGHVREFFHPPLDLETVFMSRLET
ncbi:cyclin-dependent protein kinase inhibitor SMR6-like [Lycium barbarum]|uniref:cyclin-dependent protein kinase inhibitor SMR6-like n=1 Tax=Lycium barbarum TaxID=112863 RepID=UPI00293E2368|nr:cyclin-dependent protein kinase inhibitor SMR6-like [Lycium barbarum]